MKLGISNIAWLAQEDEGILKQCQALGFTGLEVAPTKLLENPYNQSERVIGDVRKKIEDQGLSIVAMQALLFGQPDLKLFSDKAGRKSLSNYLKKAIRFGALLGAKSLVFGSPKNRLKGSMSEVEVFDISTAFFYDLGEEAKRHETCFCIEPNPKEYGADYICRTEEAVALVREVNSRGFKVNLDLSTLTINKEPYEPIKGWMEAINHVHISEPFLEAVPQATTDHQEFAKVLKNSGYSNYCSIEMKTLSQTSNVNTVEHALEKVKAIYA